jgi:hypothetical protein
MRIRQEGRLVLATWTATFVRCMSTLSRSAGDAEYLRDTDRDVSIQSSDKDERHLRLTLRDNDASNDSRPRDAGMHALCRAKACEAISMNIGAQRIVSCDEDLPNHFVRVTQFRTDALGHLHRCEDQIFDLLREEGVRCSVIQHTGRGRLHPRFVLPIS